MNTEQKKELKKYIEFAQEENKAYPGKPCSLTWEMLTQIRILLFDGHFQKTVYESMDIPKTTWESWKQKGVALHKRIQQKQLKFTALKPAEEKYLYLSYIVSVGKQKGVQKHLNNVIKAGTTDWKASKWYLEIVDRETFGQKSDINLTGDLNLKTLADKYRDRTDGK